jgi:hypothetical protein
VLLWRGRVLLLLLPLRRVSLLRGVPLMAVGRWLLLRILGRRGRVLLVVAALGLSVRGLLVTLILVMLRRSAVLAGRRREVLRLAMLRRRRGILVVTVLLLARRLVLRGRRGARVAPGAVAALAVSVVLGRLTVLSMAAAAEDAAHEPTQPARAAMSPGRRRRRAMRLLVEELAGELAGLAQQASAAMRRRAVSAAGPMRRRRAAAEEGRRQPSQARLLPGFAVRAAQGAHRETLPTHAHQISRGVRGTRSPRRGRGHTHGEAAGAILAVSILRFRARGAAGGWLSHVRAAREVPGRLARRDLHVVVLARPTRGKKKNQSVSGLLLCRR